MFGYRLSTNFLLYTHAQNDLHRMSQIKQSKMKNMSVSIPKLESKHSKKSSEYTAKVRQGAISKSIPPPDSLSKKDSLNSNMSYTNSTTKPKKTTLGQHFHDTLKHPDHAYKHPDLLKPKFKSHAPTNSIPTNPTLHRSNPHDQTPGTSFKTKAEKKSLFPMKSDENIGKDSNGNTYWYNGTKKIFKTSAEKPEREVASSGSKDCMKLIKSLRQSDPLANEALLSNLEFIPIRIQQASKNKTSKEGQLTNSDNSARSDLTDSDLKHFQDKKSSHKTHSSLFADSQDPKPKKSLKKHTQSLLTDSNLHTKISPGYDGHTQVPNMRKDNFLAKNKEALDKPPFLQRQHPSFLDHKKSPDFSYSPHKLAKQSSIEATSSPGDKKRIDPSHFPTDTQRKKRGRPPGSTDKTKKKSSKTLSLHHNSRVGRPPKKSGPLGVNSPKLKAPISLNRQIKHNLELNAKRKESKHPLSDTKVTYEVQETSENMSIDGKKKQSEESLRAADQKRKDIEKKKMKQIWVSKNHTAPFLTKPKEYKDSQIRKRPPPKLSTSSEEEESANPPPRKSPNFRDSKFSDSEIADVPKTPGATSCPPPNPWEKMDFESKEEVFRSSSPQISGSPFRKGTDTTLIRLAPTRGKYMPKNPHRQDRSPGHQLSKQPSSENETFESKPHGQNKFKPDPRSTFSGKKMVASSTFNPSSGQKQGIKPQTHDSSKDLAVSDLPSNVAESSGESSSGDTSSGSESSASSSDDSDNESHVPPSFPPQPNSMQTVLGTKRPSEIPEHPRVAYVFTTELANKAAVAVNRGDVRTIVEFHKNNQASLSHLKLSSERRQNLEKKNKSPGQNGNGTHIAEKIIDPLPPPPASSSSDTSDTTGGETDTSEPESPPPSPALSKPVKQTAPGMEESSLYNSDESSDQQEVSNSPRMIPKTPGPPPGQNLATSDEDSDDEVMKSPGPIQRPFRGKSRINMISSNRDDTYDMLAGINMVPKTPGAPGLLNRDMELSDDDDEDNDERNELKDLSDEEKNTFEFDKPPRAPRPPQLSDDEEDTRPRSDPYSRPTSSPQFDNIIKGLNSAQNLPIHEISPSISPLDLRITPRQLSPSLNPPSTHGTSSNNPSSKNTPTIIPSNESYSSQHTACAKFTPDIPMAPILTSRDSMQYNYPSAGGGQFVPDSNHGKGLPLSHYPSPSKTPMHNTPPTPSHQPSTLQEAMAAPYRTPDTRRASYIQPSLLEQVTTPELGMMQTGRKESIDAGNAPPYTVHPPISATPYLYPSRTVSQPQTYQGNQPVNLGAYMPQQHTREMFHANPTQMEQTHFNDSSPLYSQDQGVSLPSEIPGLTSRYPHPTDTLPSMQPAGSTHYYPNNTGYPQMTTPRHELQDLSYGLQSGLGAPHLNRPMAPGYTNGDSFNGVVRKQAPPTNLTISDRQESLGRTFSGVSASNLGGTPLDTNLEKLAPSLPMALSEMAQEHMSTPLNATDNFSFTETVPSPKKIMASCSTSPPPQPAKPPPPKPPKPEMVDREMQTDGDDTWDNSKPEMDEVLVEMEIEPSVPVATFSTTTSTECQTEMSPVNKVLESVLQLRPVMKEPVEEKLPMKEEEEEEGFVIRIPIHKISKDTKFLNGNLSDDFVNLDELPKLIPLNPTDRERHFQAKLGADKIANIRNKHLDPPPLRLLINSQKGMPQLTPIKNLISNGFHTPPLPSELDFRDLPKLRPLIPPI